MRTARAKWKWVPGYKTKKVKTVRAEQQTKMPSEAPGSSSGAFLLRDPPPKHMIQMEPIGRERFRESLWQGSMSCLRMRGSMLWLHMHRDANCTAIRGPSKASPPSSSQAKHLPFLFSARPLHCRDFQWHQYPRLSIWIHVAAFS